MPTNITPQHRSPSGGSSVGSGNSIWGDPATTDEYGATQYEYVITLDPEGPDQETVHKARQKERQREKGLLPGPSKLVLRSKKLARREKIIYAALLALFVSIIAIGTTQIEWGARPQKEAAYATVPWMARPIEGKSATDKPSVTDETVTAITGARLQLESSGSRDTLKVIVKDKNRDGSLVKCLFEWTKNGEVVGKEDSLTGFKRGDVVAVRITPLVGNVPGQTKTLTMEIKNAPPRVVDVKESGKGGDALTTYAVKATDPDGDPVSFALVNPPQGMVIDSKSGLLTWSHKAEQGDKKKVDIKVSDGNGGEGVWPVEITIDQVVKK